MSWIRILVSIMKDEQNIQESYYKIPYHYISSFRRGFTQCFNDTWGINYVSTIELIIEELKNEKFESIIDIGCGDGRLVYELQIEFPDKNITGIDYSKKAIAFAKTLNSLGSFSCIDITEISFLETFDCAIMMEVFEHIKPENSGKFLDGVKKLLKPNGVLFITVPHSNKPIEEHHFRHFTISSLSKELGQYFDIVDVVPFEKISIYRKIINLILTNKYFILNHARLKNILYKFYKRRLIYCENENDCQRIFMKVINNKN